MNPKIGTPPKGVGKEKARAPSEAKAEADNMWIAGFLDHESQNKEKRMLRQLRPLLAVGALVPEGDSLAGGARGSRPRTKPLNVGPIRILYSVLQQVQ